MGVLGVANLSRFHLEFSELRADGSELRAKATAAATPAPAPAPIAAAARPPSNRQKDCFDSKVDSKHVCQSECSYCTNVITHPSFEEGDEVTCWAPTGSLREGKGPFQEYPYECGSDECFKIHE